MLVKLSPIVNFINIFLEIPLHQKSKKCKYLQLAKLSHVVNFTNIIRADLRSADFLLI
jgi:hypothetical protein